MMKRLFWFRKGFAIVIAILLGCISAMGIAEPEEIATFVKTADGWLIAGEVITNEIEYESLRVITPDQEEFAPKWTERYVFKEIRYFSKEQNKYVIAYIKLEQSNSQEKEVYSNTKVEVPEKTVIQLDFADRSFEISVVDEMEKPNSIYTYPRQDDLSMKEVIQIATEYLLENGIITEDELILYSVTCGFLMEGTFSVPDQTCWKLAFDNHLNDETSFTIYISSPEGEVLRIAYAKDAVG